MISIGPLEKVNSLYMLNYFIVHIYDKITRKYYHQTSINNPFVAGKSLIKKLYSKKLYSKKRKHPGKAGGSSAHRFKC
ncbi:hypothetical protein NVIRPANT_00921 [Pantoea sp. Nvir]|nr:hypothetical protein NVIRPANT_00921 [Pantoea sp. Nvir]